MRTVQFAFTDEQRALLVEAVLCKIADLESKLASRLNIQDNRAASYADGRLVRGPKAEAYDAKIVADISAVQSTIDDFKALRNSIAAPVDEPGKTSPAFDYDAWAKTGLDG